MHAKLYYAMTALVNFRKGECYEKENCIIVFSWGYGRGDSSRVRKR